MSLVKIPKHGGNPDTSPDIENKTKSSLDTIVSFVLRMADPLSVAASIAGLLTAAQLVSAGIGRVVSSKKSGLREIRDIKTTVDTLRSVLSQLQLLLLSRASIDPRRASLIMVDEVVATLTACVMTFSDLDGCVKGLGSGEELNNLNWVGGVKWLSKSTELKGYLQNLEAHKTSLILMTNILTWYSLFLICVRSN